MSDFRSLLSSFQAVTNTAPTTPHTANTANITTTSSSNASTIPNDATVTSSSSAAAITVAAISPFDPSPHSIPTNLKECTERVFQISNLRKACQSTTTTTSNNNNNNNNSNSNSNSNTDSKQTTATPTNGNDASSTKVHIAICATIVDQFPHESIWKRWMETGTSTHSTHNDATAGSTHPISATAELYIHAKFPPFSNTNTNINTSASASASTSTSKTTTTSSKYSDWVSSKILPQSYKPNWNDIKVVRAMLLLLEHALADPRTTHVLFCTESCVPITSLYDAATGLILDPDDQESRKRNGIENKHRNQNRSFVPAYDRTSPACTRFDEYNCFGILEPYIPPDAIWKALPGWILLSRHHAMAIQNLPTQLYQTIPSPSSSTSSIPLWPAFENVWAPEEVYFPTALALTGHLPSPDIIATSMTHSKWDTHAKDHSQRAHPKVYDNEGFTYDLIQRVRGGDSHPRNANANGYACLFMRKWKQSIDIQTWERVVLENRDDGIDRRTMGHGYGRNDHASYSSSSYSNSNHGHSRKRHRYPNHHQNYRNHQRRSEQYEDDHRDRNSESYSRKRNNTNHDYYR